MKKILFLYSAVNYGGLVRNLSNIVNSLDCKKFEIFIYSVDTKEETVRLNTNFKINYLEAKSKIDISAIIKLRKILKQEKINILSCHSFKPNFYGLFASIFLDTKTIAMLHGWVGQSLKLHIYQYLDRFLIRFFNKIIVLAEYQKIQLKKLLINQSKIFVNYNAVDTKYFSSNFEPIKREELNIPIEAVVLISVSRLEPEKQVFQIINSLAKVDNPKFYLLILGNGRELEKLKAQAKDLKLEKNILFLGQVKDIRPYTSISDIFITASKIEGLPNSLLEAQCCGIPVIASNITAHQEIIKDNETGVLFNLDDCSDLSYKIKSLASNSDLREKIKKKARANIEEKFTLVRRISELEKIYI